MVFLISLSMISSRCFGPRLYLLGFIYSLSVLGHVHVVQVYVPFPGRGGARGVFEIELMHWINPVSLLIKDQASDLYALSSLGVIRRIGVYEGRVRSESSNAIMSARPALTRRVKTLDKHGLVWRHILHVLFGKLWFSLSCYTNQNNTEEPSAPAVQHAEPSSTKGPQRSLCRLQEKGQQILDGGSYPELVFLVGRDRVRLTCIIEGR